MRKQPLKDIPPPCTSPYPRGGWVGLLSIIVILFSVAYAYAEKPEKWSGVDESVIGKYAKEHGREAREPLINTDQGDLLLFVFLLAGTIGGFAAGYYWRTLTENRSQNPESRSRTEENNR